MKNPKSTWYGYNAVMPFAAGCKDYAEVIFSFIASNIAVKRWKDLSFCDMFAGSGSMALTARRYKFRRVVTNDYLYMCYLGNKFVIESDKKYQWLEMMNEWLSRKPIFDDRFVTENFAEYFVPNGAELIDMFLSRAKAEDELYIVLRIAMVLSGAGMLNPITRKRKNNNLVYAMECVFNPKMLFYDVVKQINSIAHLETQKENTAYNLDYKDFIQAEHDVDLVHLHPPYGYADYTDYYRVYESIVKKQVEIVRAGAKTNLNGNLPFVKKVFAEVRYDNWLVQLTSDKVSHGEMCLTLDPFVTIVDMKKIERKNIPDKYLYFCRRK